MARRVEIVAECVEHGMLDPHCTVSLERHRCDHVGWCPGGSRRVLGPGEVLKGVYVAGSAIVPTRYATVQDVLDALAEGEQ